MGKKNVVRLLSTVSLSTSERVYCARQPDPAEAKASKAAGVIPMTRDPTSNKTYILCSHERAKLRSADYTTFKQLKQQRQANGQRWQPSELPPQDPLRRLLEQYQMHLHVLAGKIDPGENAQQAALREGIEESSGITSSLGWDGKEATLEEHLQNSNNTACVWLPDCKMLLFSWRVPWHQQLLSETPRLFLDAHSSLNETIELLEWVNIDQFSRHALPRRIFIRPLERHVHTIAKLLYEKSNCIAADGPCLCNSR